jgi:hypothetical protein
VSAGGHRLKKACAISGPVQTLIMNGEVANANISTRFGRDEESAIMISSVKNMPLALLVLKNEEYYL